MLPPVYVGHAIVVTIFDTPGARSCVSVGILGRCLLSPRHRISSATIFWQWVRCVAAASARTAHRDMPHGVTVRLSAAVCVIADWPLPDVPVTVTAVVTALGFEAPAQPPRTLIKSSTEKLAA